MKQVSICCWQVFNVKVINKQANGDLSKSGWKDPEAKCKVKYRAYMQACIGRTAPLVNGQDPNK